MSLKPVNVQRDPYPFPKLEGDVQFRKEGSKCKKRPTSTTSEAQAKV